MSLETLQTFDQSDKKTRKRVEYCDVRAVSHSCDVLFMCHLKRVGFHKQAIPAMIELKMETR